MRKWVIFGLVALTIMLIAGNAEAASTIDTSNIFLMAYYNSSTNIDLSQAIQEFDFVTESTGQYVEGKVRIWYDNPDGRNPGNIQDFELRDGVDTNIFFATNVTVRVRSDGWIVAWLTNDQSLNDIVSWDDANSEALPSNTTLSMAIWRITDKIGANYNQSEIKYYSYKYPSADRLLIGGRVTSTAPYHIQDGSTYYFMIPSTNTVYDAKIIWTSYSNNEVRDDASYSGKIKLDFSYIYDKNTTIFYIDQNHNIAPYNFKGLYEYEKYFLNIIGIPRDTRHTVYMESDVKGMFFAGSYGKSTLKSAVAILYKTG